MFIRVESLPGKEFPRATADGRSIGIPKPARCYVHWRLDRIENLEIITQIEVLEIVLDPGIQEEHGLTG